MRKIRVFVDLPLAGESLVHLPVGVTEHLTRVLRLRHGFLVTCFNGDGRDYDGRLSLDGKRAQLHLLDSRAVNSESVLRLTLVQSIARGEKMDLILQKATELGVARIVPIVSERTEVKLDEERADRRMNHWRRVIEAACEQCGRARLPQLLPPQALAGFAESVAGQAGARLLLHPEATQHLHDVAATDDYSVAIGPEGGFSERDLATLGQAGFTAVRLGPRVLRAETAGIAALTALQTLFGDLG